MEDFNYKNTTNQMLTNNIHKKLIFVMTGIGGI